MTIGDEILRGPFSDAVAEVLPILWRLWKRHKADKAAFKRALATLDVSLEAGRADVDAALEAKHGDPDTLAEILKDDPT